MIKSNCRVVVLTGAGRGLGRALALELTRLGHRVHACVRREPDEGLRAILATEGGSVEIADTSDPSSVDRWASQILRSASPDLVVNNAAVIHANNLLEDIPVAEIQRVLSVNVLGVANVCRAFLPALKSRGRGVIANLSSGAGRTGFAEISVYCASKFAVEGLTQALAAELPSGLAAVAVSPGLVDTDMLRKTRGAGAGESPSPELWARTAAPFFLGLDHRHNGSSLTTPECLG